MKVIRVARVAKEPWVNKLFTGQVTMQPIIGTDLSKNFLIQQVNFGEGVRNKFHSHSIEQVLIVTEGKGIVATDEEEITVRPGMSYSLRRGRNTGMVPLKVVPSHIFMSCRLIRK